MEPPGSPDNGASTVARFGERLPTLRRTALCTLLTTCPITSSALDKAAAGAAARGHSGSSLVIAGLLAAGALWLSMMATEVALRVAMHTGSRLLEVATASACAVLGIFSLLAAGKCFHAPEEQQATLGDRPERWAQRWAWQNALALGTAGAAVLLVLITGMRPRAFFTEAAPWLCGAYLFAALAIIGTAIGERRARLSGQSKHIHRWTVTRRAFLGIAAIGVAGGTVFAATRNIRRYLAAAASKRPPGDPVPEQPGFYYRDLSKTGSTSHRSSIPTPDDGIATDKLPRFHRRSPRPVLHYISRSQRIYDSKQWPQRSGFERVSFFGPEPGAKWLGSSEFLSLQEGADGSTQSLLSVEALRREEFQPASEQGGGRENVLKLPHVSLASASWAFESAALQILEKKQLGRTELRHACELLIYGINHSCFLRSISPGRPSFRLFDLLAAVSVRYRQQWAFDELRRIIDVAGLEPYFTLRLIKWQDPLGAWRKKWLDSEKACEWAGVLLSSKKRYPQRRR